MFDFILANTDNIIVYASNHFSLSISAILISLILWIPVGILMAKNEKAASIVNTISNILYCIPSIAMFAILITIPFLGLGRLSAVIALILYSMMPMTTSVYTGITNVDQSLIEAVRGMGMNSKDILLQVELPLAVPSIFSGFRLMSIMIISTATLATYIGERNLGRLISQGLSRSDMDMVLTGAFLVSAIAIILDYLFLFIENKLNRYETKGVE